MSPTIKNNMPPKMRKLLALLRKCPGRVNSIHRVDLYEQWADYTFETNSEGRITEDVSSKTRTMRRMINTLIEEHGIPIMSSSTDGYWIVENERELEEVCNEFRRRGLTSLMKSARLANISLIEAVQQIVLDLNDNTSILNKTIYTRRKKQVPVSDLIVGPDAKLAVITKYINELFENPTEYADQINALQREFGPKFITRSVINSMQYQIQNVRRAAAQLERMVL